MDAASVLPRRFPPGKEGSSKHEARCCHCWNLIDLSVEEYYRYTDSSGVTYFYCSCMNEPLWYID